MRDEPCHEAEGLDGMYVVGFENLLLNGGEIGRRSL